VYRRKFDMANRIPIVHVRAMYNTFKVLHTQQDKSQSRDGQQPGTDSTCPHPTSNDRGRFVSLLCQVNRGVVSVELPSSEQYPDNPAIAIASLHDYIPVGIDAGINPVVECGEYLRRLKPVSTGRGDGKLDPIDSQQKRGTVCACPEHPSDGVLADNVRYDADHDRDCGQAPAKPSSCDDRRVRVEDLQSALQEVSGALGKTGYDR
jgi:hypothetical protein